METVVGGILAAFGLSASAGLNAYIPLLIVSLMAKFTGLIKLAEPWDALTSWWTIGVLLALSLVEFFVDKVPLVDHINDLIQTFIRPTAGAILFAASAKAITDIHPVISIVAGLLVAGSVHVVKSVAVRPLITATTAGAGDAPVSTIEDIISTLVSLISVVIPALIAVVFTVMVIWLLWWLSNRVERKRVS